MSKVSKSPKEREKQNAANEFLTPFKNNNNNNSKDENIIINENISNNNNDNNNENKNVFVVENNNDNKHFENPPSPVVDEVQKHLIAEGEKEEVENDIDNNTVNDKVNNNDNSNIDDNKNIVENKNVFDNVIENAEGEKGREEVQNEAPPTISSIDGIKNYVAKNVKLKFADTHIQDTFWIKKEKRKTLQKLLEKCGKGKKTQIIDEALDLWFEKHNIEVK